MRNTAQRWIWLVALLLTLATWNGCGGDGGSSGSSGEPPADVSGIWEGGNNNAGSAILTCSGDFADLSGLTVAGWVAAAPDCSAFEIEVVQSGSSFTFVARDVVCNDGSVLTWSGGGSVTGNTFSGQFDTIFITQNMVRVESFTGVVNGNTIDLLEDRIVWSGSMAGACNIAPALSLQVTIHP